MKKIILLLAGLTHCFFTFANPPIAWIYFNDSDNNDMRLLLTATCSISGQCPTWIGVGLRQWSFIGAMTIQDASIQNQQWQIRDIFHDIPKNCLTITAPQTITFNVDSNGQVKVACTSK